MRDPREVVKVGDIVHVRVLDVDAARKRISLSMRSREKTAKPASVPSSERFNHGTRPQSRPVSSSKTPSGAMAAAFAGLKLKR